MILVSADFALFWWTCFIYAKDNRMLSSRPQKSNVATMVKSTARHLNVIDYHIGHSMLDTEITNYKNERYKNKLLMAPQSLDLLWRLWATSVLVLICLSEIKAKKR